MMRFILILFVGLISNYTVYSQDNLYNYPEILEKSLNGLKIINDEWISTSFKCFDEETVVMVKQIQNNIIAVTANETTFPSTFFLYTIELDGTEENKIMLTNADYSMVNRNNLIENDGILYYFVTTGEKKEYEYNLTEKTNKLAISGHIDWDRIEDWRSDFFFLSQSGNYQIVLSDASLVFNDLVSNTSDTLISQEYDLTWSFGQGFWSSDEQKFYFDNSGPVACIWELDLTKKTLNKIVPEHWAQKPIFFNDTTGFKIMYSLENCIFIVEPKK